MSGDLVLVTGGSGFVGSRCILQLLHEGYRVRATVRSLGREAALRDTLAAAGAAPDAPFEVAAADLTADDGWAQAAAGCRFVLHVASPFPSSPPADEDELIVPAREGTRRVMAAALAAGVQRVVLTSSFAAVGYGHPPTDQPFDEASWTVPGPGVSAYAKSKTLAERVAWQLVQESGGAVELSVVNPVVVFGPVLNRDYSSSVHIVDQLLAGAMPRLARITFGVVDVRDVADLHVRAMVSPAAAGERFIATAGMMSLQDIARVLVERVGGPPTAKVPTKVLPDWAVRLAAVVLPPARQAVPELGSARRSTSEKARRVLGWEPRPAEDAVVATAESLIALAAAPAAN